MACWRQRQQATIVAAAARSISPVNCRIAGRRTARRRTRLERYRRRCKPSTRQRRRYSSWQRPALQSPPNRGLTRKEMQRAFYSWSSPKIGWLMNPCVRHPLTQGHIHRYVGCHRALAVRQREMENPAAASVSWSTVKSKPFISTRHAPADSQTGIQNNAVRRHQFQIL